MGSKSKSQTVLALAIAGGLLVLVVAGVATMLLLERTGSSDDVAIPRQVERWLASQKRGEDGLEFWDEYARTSVDGPNLSPYALESVERMRRWAEKDRSNGNSVEEQKTVLQSTKLTGVESWRIASVGLRTYDARERAFKSREAHAVCSVDVTMRRDGKSVTWVIEVTLYKHRGQWGISHVLDRGS